MLHKLFLVHYDLNKYYYVHLHRDIHRDLSKWKKELL